MDRAWPTMPFRETTAIGGSSMGGLMAMFAVLRYNRWISKAACLSSSFRFCPEEIVSEAENAAVDPDTRVYLSWGSAECAGHAALTAATGPESAPKPYPHGKRRADLSLPPCGRPPLRSRLGRRGAPLPALSLDGMKNRPARQTPGGADIFCAWAARVRPVAAFMPAAR